MSGEIDIDVLRELPKVELHLHLEGAIPLDCLWELVKKYGEASKVGSISERFAAAAVVRSGSLRALRTKRPSIES